VETGREYDLCMVTWSSSATLGAALEAVRRLDPAPERVVVVDNASDDDSAAIAEAAGAQVTRESTNTGFAGGMNTALAVSDAPWVLLLNPDCAPRPDFVGRLLDAVARQDDPSTVGSVTGLLVRSADDGLTEGDVIDAAGMVVTPSGRHFDRLSGEPRAAISSRPAFVFGGTGAATLFRRSALEDVAYEGGEVFASTFFAYREDAELAWRLQHRGWSCLFAHDAVAAHRRGFQPETGRAGHGDVNRHSVRNRFLLRAHCADAAWHVRHLPDWLARDLLVVGGCLTVERGSLPGLAEAWRLRADARARRRWVLDRATAPPGRVRRWFRRPAGWVDEETAR
jgi:GT2 family glycosyltransferase